MKIEQNNYKRSLITFYNVIIYNMPSSRLEKQYTLTPVQNKLVDIVLNNTYQQLIQILRQEKSIIRKILLEKIIWQ